MRRIFGPNKIKRYLNIKMSLIIRPFYQFEKYEVGGTYSIHGGDEKLRRT
jgi:hypothetical protein